MRDAILAIDVGTQSARALIFDRVGKLLDSGRTVYEPAYHSPEPGWAEQDPDYYWECVGRACRQLWERDPAARDRLAGVCMTFQRGTVVHLDGHERPLRPAFVWLDQRRCGRPPRLPAGWRTALTLAGAGTVVDRFQAEAEVNWVAEHQPDIQRRTARLLLLSGFVTLRMTGRARDSVACCVGYLPFDFKRLGWCRPADWKWKALVVDPAALPELVPPGGMLGEVGPEAALHTGIPSGLPVVSGGSDKACEVLGSGCLEPYQGCIGFGTTATFNVDSGSYIEPVRLVPPYPGARPGRYNLEYQVFRGFWMVTWFKEQFAAVERQRALAQGRQPEELLEELAAAVEPGSLGLILQPYWTPGLKHPGPEGKGAIIGFGAAHHRHHVYRALLEGLAYEMRAGRELVEARTGRPVTELTVCGGGSRSDLVMQIAADVFGLAARRPSCPEASGLGAAILGAAGVGLYPDISAAVAAMTSPGRVFQPQAGTVRTYDRLYRSVYRPLYGRLKPLYRAIRQITGYPPFP